MTERANECFDSYQSISFFYQPLKRAIPFSNSLAFIQSPEIFSERSLCTFRFVVDDVDCIVCKKTFFMSSKNFCVNGLSNSCTVLEEKNNSSTNNGKSSGFEMSKNQQSAWVIYSKKLKAWTTIAWIIESKKLEALTTYGLQTVKSQKSAQQLHGSQTVVSQKPGQQLHGLQLVKFRSIDNGDMVLVSMLQGVWLSKLVNMSHLHYLHYF